MIKQNKQSTLSHINFIIPDKSTINKKYGELVSKFSNERLKDIRVSDIDDGKNINAIKNVLGKKLQINYLTPDPSLINQKHKELQKISNRLNETIVGKFGTTATKKTFSALKKDEERREKEETKKEYEEEKKMKSVSYNLDLAKSIMYSLLPESYYKNIDPSIREELVQKARRAATIRNKLPNALVSSINKLVKSRDPEEIIEYMEDEKKTPTELKETADIFYRQIQKLESKKEDIITIIKELEETIKRKKEEIKKGTDTIEEYEFYVKSMDELKEIRQLRKSLYETEKEILDMNEEKDKLQKEIKSVSPQSTKIKSSIESDLIKLFEKRTDIPSPDEEGQYRKKIFDEIVKEAPKLFYNEEVNIGNIIDNPNPWQEIDLLKRKREKLMSDFQQKNYLKDQEISQESIKNDTLRKKIEMELTRLEKLTGIRNVGDVMREVNLTYPNVDPDRETARQAILKLPNPVKIRAEISKYGSNEKTKLNKSEANLRYIIKEAQLQRIQDEEILRDKILTIDSDINNAELIGKITSDIKRMPISLLASRNINMFDEIKKRVDSKIKVKGKTPIVVTREKYLSLIEPKETFMTIEELEAQAALPPAAQVAPEQVLPAQVLPAAAQVAPAAEQKIVAPGESVTTKLAQLVTGKPGNVQGLAQLVTGKPGNVQELAQTIAPKAVPGVVQGLAPGATPKTGSKQLSKEDIEYKKLQLKRYETIKDQVEKSGFLKSGKRSDAKANLALFNEAELIEKELKSKFNHDIKDIIPETIPPK